MDLKDNETLINAGGQIEEQNEASGSGDSPGTVRRSTRTRKEPLKFQSSHPAPVPNEEPAPPTTEATESPKIRRSTRPRKEPLKFQSPCASPSPVNVKRSASPKMSPVLETMSSSISSTTASSASMSSGAMSTDSEEVVEKRRKTVRKGKGKKRGRKPMKKKETVSKKKESLPKKVAGPKMTAYDKMIQKNIEERNALVIIEKFKNRLFRVMRLNNHLH